MKFEYIFTLISLMVVGLFLARRKALRSEKRSESRKELLYAIGTLLLLYLALARFGDSHIIKEPFCLGNGILLADFGILLLIFMKQPEGN